MSRYPMTPGDLDDVRHIASRCLGPLTGVEHLPSHGNIVVRLRLADGRRRILKMARRPGQAAGAFRRHGTDGSVVREPAVYALLRHHGVAAPRVHCAEGGSGTVGRAWFVCDDLGRRTAADLSGLSPHNRRRLFADMGRLLARIHAVPATQHAHNSAHSNAPATRPGPASPNPLAAWHRRQLAEARASGVFRGAAGDAIEVLAAHVPAVTPRPADASAALCHGDFHAAQVIRRGVRVIAAVDWESAYAGDAGYDHAAFEVMLRVTSPADLADAALAAYASAHPLFDRAAYAWVRTAHAVSLSLAFTAARRPAYARAARLYAERRLSVGVAA